MSFCVGKRAPIACDATVRVCCGAVLFGVCSTVLVQDIVIVGNFPQPCLLLDFLSAGPHCGSRSTIEIRCRNRMSQVTKDHTKVGMVAGAHALALATTPCPMTRKQGWLQARQRSQGDRADASPGERLLEAQPPFTRRGVRARSPETRKVTKVSTATSSRYPMTAPTRRAKRRTRLLTSLLQAPFSQVRLAMASCHRRHPQRQ